MPCLSCIAALDDENSIIHENVATLAVSREVSYLFTPSISVAHTERGNLQPRFFLEFLHAWNARPNSAQTSPLTSWRHALSI